MVYIFMLIGAGLMRKEIHSTLPPTCLFNVGRGNVAMFSAMMQAVIIQMCVLPMYAELEDRTPKRFSGTLNLSFSILFLIFSAFAIIGHFATVGMSRATCLR